MSQLKPVDLSHVCLSWSTQGLSCPAGRNFLNGLEVICIMSTFYPGLGARAVAEEVFQWSRVIVSNQAEALLLVGAVDL